jgi:hypothetical protein
VRHLKRRPSLEKLLRVAHAVSQLSGAYMKAIESISLAEFDKRLTALEAETPEMTRNGTSH